MHCTAHSDNHSRMQTNCILNPTNFWAVLFDFYICTIVIDSHTLCINSILQVPAAYVPVDPESPPHLSAHVMMQCCLRYILIQRDFDLSKVSLSVVLQGLGSYQLMWTKQGCVNSFIVGMPLKQKCTNFICPGQSSPSWTKFAS